MRTITPEERRARLGRRHALATEHRATTVTDAARAVVALHGSDPASTVLSALARTHDATPADVEHALYDERSLVRILSMRRTVFAVPREIAGTCLVAASDVVARQQRRLLLGLLAASDVDADPEAWLARAERAALHAVAAAGEITSADLGAADPLLATRVRVGTGHTASAPSVASRLLLLLSAEGHVVRTRPRGGWTSTQFRWATTDAWCDLGPRPEPAAAAADLAHRWLRAYGPATAEDLQWWAGWTMTRTRAALAGLDTTEVEIDGRVGLVLTADAEPVEAPAPWVALLPALDPTPMGWRHRDFMLGPHRGPLFDTTGNAGPTVWVDGAAVGAWAQRDDGRVAVHLLHDVGASATRAVTERAEQLTAELGDVRLKARARRWTALETQLRA
jgi:hypothetical protein